MGCEDVLRNKLTNNNLMEEFIYMFGKDKKESRFVIKEKEEQAFGFNFITVCIVVDTQTGVNYLMTVGTGLNAMTPLLDSDGKVLIDRGTC